MNIDRIIEDQIKTYRENFIKHKDSSLGTFQNDRATQHQRFEFVIKPFKEVLVPGTSFHDVGCGSCDLYEYLVAQGYNVDYSGTELIDEMIQYARTKFPGIALYKRDIFSKEVTDRYDIVVFSGGLYFPGSIKQTEWRDFVFKMVDRMFEMCRVGISFNLLTTYTTFRNENLFYLDPKEMFDHCCTKLSRFVSLEQNYPLYEWTIAVWKKEFIAQKYPQPEFKKYFQS